MWRRAAVVSALAIAAVAGMVGASAASLGGIDGGGLFAASGGVTYPAAQRTVSSVDLAVTGSPAIVTSATIVVTGSSVSGMAGQTVRLVTFDSGGVQRIDVSATLGAGNLAVSGSTATITLPVAGAPARSQQHSWAVLISGVQVLGPDADPSARFVTTANGLLPVYTSTWEDEVIENPNPNTEIVTVEPADYNVNSQQACLIVRITGKTATPAPWSFQLDWSAGPFFGNQPTHITGAVIQSQSGTVMTIVGSGGDATVTNTQVREIVACDYQMVLPDRPEAYTVSAPFNGTWTNTKACRSVTVTGNGTYPFHFGFKVTIDMAPAFARLREFDPNAPRSMDFIHNMSPAFDQNVTVYTVANQEWNTIAGTQSRVVTLCANRW